MSQRGMNPWVKVFVNFFRSLNPVYYMGNARKGKFVGRDHLGNEYFENTEAIGISNKDKPIRFFRPSKQENWDKPLPAEWDSWLRMRRLEPPSVEESMASLKRIENLKKKYGKEEITSSGNFPQFPEYEDIPGSKYK